MQDAKQEIVEVLKKANNVLVTVSNNPSIDQLSAGIGLTLTLNKLGKHATAVYSGDTPSTIEFLEPADTYEKNTDSLRDFIISLDKAKADKLKYKVEDNVVKIFITPYRSSISDKDLEFTQGDFNVDVVLALGVKEQTDLDEAIRAHGRILHDAKVVTINDSEGAEIGGISWVDTATSSLSELTAELARELDAEALDEQIATAFLTGIVASTDRFSNERTSANTMKTSAMLMAAGANQQLVATKLTPEPAPVAAAEPLPLENDDADSETNGDELPDVAIAEDGTLKISHEAKLEEHAEPVPEVPREVPNDVPVDQLQNPIPPMPPAPVDDFKLDGALAGADGLSLPPAPEPPQPPEHQQRTFVGHPGGEDDALRHDAETDTDLLETLPEPTPTLPASLPASSKRVIQPLPNEQPPLPTAEPSLSPAPAPAVPQPQPVLPEVPRTLEELERAVHSSHVEPKPAADQIDHHELDLSMLQTPSGIQPDQGTPLPQPQQQQDGSAPPVPPPIIPPFPQ